MQDQFSISIDKLLSKLQLWLEIIILNIPNFLIALFIFCISYFISQKLKTLIDQGLVKRIKQESIRSLIANVNAIFIVIIGIFLALSILNLDKALTSILAGAGVAGLAVGLALQGTLSNTFSGVFLAVQDIMNVGDFVETNGYSGTVVNINLRYLTLRETDNNIVIIPNKLVVEKPFKNYGLTQQVRTSIDCGVGYNSNLTQVQSLTKSIINKHFPQNGKEIEFFYTEFGDSSINFIVRFWVDAKKFKTVLEAKSTAIMLLKDSFDRNSIEIPYPITSVLTPNYANN